MTPFMFEVSLVCDSSTRKRPSQYELNEKGIVIAANEIEADEKVINFYQSRLAQSVVSYNIRFFETIV